MIQAVKNISAMQKIWVLSLGQVLSLLFLEKEMATHSSILA